MRLFPEKLENIWNAWQVRVLIVISLTLQVILIIFGARRKLTASMMLRMVVWSAYMVADSVASIALGNLAHTNLVDGQDKFAENKNVLQAFWAPFLLLHLGGPDTITAYSLEDNELWKRHLLGLLLQIGLALYVFFRSWSNTALTFLAIPMFVTGITKYGERTFALWSSSMDHFRNSLQSAPAPVLANDRIDPDPEDNYVVQASSLFERSKYLFANLILDYHGQDDPCYAIVHEKSAEDAFKLVESELGLMYDVLFTKAAIVHSRVGIFLRCLSFFSSVTALIVFSIIIDIHAYPIADVYATYSLLVAAVFLEIYASILFLLSDWTKIWLIKQSTAERTPNLEKVIQFLSTPSKRWSRSMAQYSLVKSCLKHESATFIGFMGKLVDMRFWYLTWTRVDTVHDLRKNIFEHIKEKSNEVLNNLSEGSQLLKQSLNRRGDYVLEKGYSLDGLRGSTTEVEFDHSLLVWHIATDLCYHEDFDGNKELDETKASLSKTLSDYLLYLLVFCPSMLQKGISYEIRYNDTYNAITRTLKVKGEGDDAGLPYKKLLKHEDHTQAIESNMSVLNHGQTLANTLQGLDWDKEKKWKMISEVWMEMLVYAASHCAWKEHAQQLQKGGELLTHVSLIMAHLGLSEQYHTKHLYGNMSIRDRGSWSDLF